MHGIIKTLTSSRITTTHLCDAYPSARVVNFLNPIVPKKFVGIAHTVNTMGDIVPVWKAIETATEGAVLVIDTRPSKNAVIGEFLTQFALGKKVAAIVLFGFCRDSDSIKELGIPFFAMGTNPKAGTKIYPGIIGCELNIDSVSINEGDCVIGDSDGIVIMSEEELNDSLPKAITVMEKEKAGQERIKNGATINDVFNFREHYEKLMSNEKSDLTLS